MQNNTENVKLVVDCANGLLSYNCLEVVWDPDNSPAVNLEKKVNCVSVGSSQLSPSPSDSLHRRRHHRDSSNLSMTEILRNTTLEEFMLAAEKVAREQREQQEEEDEEEHRHSNFFSTSSTNFVSDKY